MILKLQLPFLKHKNHKLFFISVGNNLDNCCSRQVISYSRRRQDQDCSWLLENLATVSERCHSNNNVVINPSKPKIVWFSQNNKLTTHYPGPAVFVTTLKESKMGARICCQQYTLKCVNSPRSPLVI